LQLRKTHILKLLCLEQWGVDNCFIGMDAHCLCMFENFHDNVL
jgi:hypothetical protein